MIIRPSEWRADRAAQSTPAQICAHCGATMAKPNEQARAWLLTSVCDGCADDMMEDYDNHDSNDTEQVSTRRASTGEVIAFPSPSSPQTPRRIARR